LELLQLRYFIKVAELESITKAAKFYMIPQPSMSQTITRLERELNTKLFDRRSGKLFLNDNGKLFYQHVAAAIREVDNGVASLTAVSGDISGSVKIKIMDSHRFILNCIPKFTKLYPQICISASHGYYEDQDVTYDLCVSSLPSYQHMTECAPIVKERIILAVHEDNPLAKRQSISMEDLRGEKLISMPARSALYNTTVSLCHAYGFEPQIPIICDDPYFVRKYVSENMGVALAPELSWTGRFRSNTVLLPISDPPIFTTSYLLWDGNRFLPPAVQKFKQFILNQAAGIPGNILENQADFLS